MKILIINNQSPGDIIMLTAAVRDLKIAHPHIEIGVRTAASEIWDNNPYINRDINEKNADKVIRAEYNLIHKSNQLPYHFIHGFVQDLEQKLNLKIPITAFHGDIHLSDEEKGWISQVEELGHKNNFWIIMAGGKYDFTAKWWNPQYYQKVVNKLKTEVKFVQCGSGDHWHTPLNGVINLVGNTGIRQFIRLMYHAQGVVCPVTFAMHLAAAVPVKDGMPKNRPCVVIAGGREPAQWEAYPHHRYLSTNGALMCCDNGGCWKSRCQKVGDGDEKDKEENLCHNRVEITEDLCIPKCMDMVKPVDVIRAVRMYFDGGAIKPYQIGGGMNRKKIISSGEINIKANKDIMVFGLKRSGNHMLLDWIVNQHSPRNFFLNDLSHGRLKKRMFNDMKSNRLPNHSDIMTGNEASVTGVNLFIESYEDVLPHNNFHKNVDSNNHIRVAILRDYRNWICSLYMMFKDKNLNKVYSDFIPKWIKYARMFIGDDDIIKVKYDNFVSDVNYRDLIADKIGVDFRSDNSLDDISSYGWSSSFDGTKYDGSARKMDVLNRYKEYESEDWYINAMKFGEAISLNEELFG
jgi:ADP-heptose:LPS heptosyltransferase